MLGGCDIGFHGLYPLSQLGCGGEYRILLQRTAAINTEKCDKYAQFAGILQDLVLWRKGMRLLVVALLAQRELVHRRSIVYEVSVAQEAFDTQLQGALARLSDDDASPLQSQAESPDEESRPKPDE